MSAKCKFCGGAPITCADCGAWMITNADGDFFCWSCSSARRERIATLLEAMKLVCFGCREERETYVQLYFINNVQEGSQIVHGVGTDYVYRAHALVGKLMEVWV